MVLCSQNSAGNSHSELEHFHQEIAGFPQYQTPADRWGTRGRKAERNLWGGLFVNNFIDIFQIRTEFHPENDIYYFLPCSSWQIRKFSIRWIIYKKIMGRLSLPNSFPLASTIKLKRLFSPTLICLAIVKKLKNETKIGDPNECIIVGGELKWKSRVFKLLLWSVFDKKTINQIQKKFYNTFSPMNYEENDVIRTCNILLHNRQ